uniref:Uncharacterized protein n=1 Tax=Meloidogyne floridensis TaxID=298350 RepID=A0A915NYL5_9BILA
MKAPSNIYSPHSSINLKNKLANNQTKLLNNNLTFNFPKNKIKCEHCPKKFFCAKKSDEEYKKCETEGLGEEIQDFVSKKELIINRNDLENKINFLVERQLKGKNKRRRVQNMLILPFNDLKRNKEIFDNREMGEMIKREKNLKMVANIIKNGDLNVDEKLEDKEVCDRNFLIINDLKEAAKLKIILDECDLINEFLMALCLAEEQMNFYRDWLSQHCSIEIHHVLNSIFDVESVEELKHIDIIVKDEIDSLNSSEKILLKYYSGSQKEVDEILDRIKQASNVIYKAAGIVKRLIVDKQLCEERKKIFKIENKNEEDEKLNKDGAEELKNEELEESRKKNEVEDIVKEELKEMKEMKIKD